MCDNRKAVLYCRVAPGAGKINEWLWLQRENLRKTAHQQGLLIAGEVIACEPGSTMRRPGWASVLRTLQQTQANVLVVTSCSRISRNTMELFQTLSQLDVQGVKVQTAGPLQEQPLQLWKAFSSISGEM